MQTIAEAKKYLRENFEEGVSCPCCGQLVKLYKRKITSSMAYGLIILAKNKKVGELVHLLNFFKSIENVAAGIAGDLPKLRWWGLLEAVEEEREDGNPNNGYYVLTTTRKLFVDGLTKVPKHIFLYNNKVQNKSQEMTTIRECLGDKFNYEELMGGVSGGG